MPASDHPSLGDYGLLILLAAIWGGSFLFIKLAVDTVPAATLTALRLIIGAAILYAVILTKKINLPRGSRTWGLILVAALFGNALPFTLISWGEEAIDSGLAAILMAVMPLTTVLLAHIATRDEKLNARKAIGVFLGLAGLVVLIGPEKLAELGNETIRQLAVAAAAMCYGVNALVTKWLMDREPYGLVTAIIIAAAAMLIPISLLVDRPWTLSPSAMSVWSIITLGLLQTAIGTLLLFAIVRRRGASFFSQINFIIPLFGVTWGAIFLSETLPPDALTALALILIGIAIARSGIGQATRAAPPTPSRQRPN